MQFQDIKTLQDVPVWVREHLADNDTAEHLLRDIELSFSHIDQMASRRDVVLELKSDGGEATHQETGQKYTTHELHVKIPDVGNYGVIFILTLEGKITNMHVRELGLTKAQQGSIQLQGFRQIQSLPDVAEWIASDGINPDASIEFIDLFEEHATAFMRGMSRRGKLELRLGYAQDLLKPDNDRFRVVQLVTQHPHRTTMVVFSMLNGRIQSAKAMSEDEFKNFPAVNWQYLQ